MKKCQSLPAGHAANCRSHWPVSVQTRPAAPWLPAPPDSSETPAIPGSAIQTSHLMDQFLFPCMQTLLLWDTCQHYGPVSLSMHIPCFSEASAILGSAIQTHNFMGLFLFQCTYPASLRPSAIPGSAIQTHNFMGLFLFQCTYPASLRLLPFKVLQYKPITSWACFFPSMHIYSTKLRLLPFQVLQYKSVIPEALFSL